jgi:hypothetical protein
VSWLGRCLAANPAVRAFITREAVQVARRRREAVETLAAAGLERAPGGGLRWIGGPPDEIYIRRGRRLHRMHAAPPSILVAAIERAAERRADR